MKRDEAIALMAEMEKAVRARWYETARACGAIAEPPHGQPAVHQI